MMGRDWMASALCAQVDADAFFPDTVGVGGRRQAAAAQAICEQCPVILECRMYAKQIGASAGVWGGQLMRPGSGPQFQPIAHGTPAGYRAHYRRGERPCRSCVQADAVKRDEQKRCAS